MDAYRIADSRYPIFDPMGAALYGARWTSAGKRAIYASETYAGAMLELLVHRNASSLPGKHKFVHILVPDSVTVETLLPVNLPGWDDDDTRASQAFGDEWFESRRTAILRVPSVVTHGPEFNLIFNTLHPQFSLIQAGEPQPVIWDSRLAS